MPPQSPTGESPTERFRLDGRVVILTGASSGLGARFAHVLDGAGARVVLAARRAERLEALAGQLRHSVAMPCDLSDAGERERLVATTLERFDRVDVLVNNAGVTRVVPALEESDNEFTEVLILNLVAPFSLARATASAMVDRGIAGSIVNVASILGMVGVGQIPQAGYAAAKGGLINLTRELAAQWGRQGIRVNALAPGWFPTEMTADMFDDDRSLQWMERKTALGRGGKEHELDGALLFLASDTSTYVTGQVLAVDGGYTAI